MSGRRFAPGARIAGPAERKPGISVLEGYRERGHRVAPGTGERGHPAERHGREESVKVRLLLDVVFAPGAKVS